MIYLDTSVFLAELLADDRTLPARLWESDLVSSRLLEFELWTRVHAFLDLSPAVLGRALEPFPAPVRTLDALHLASMDYARSCGRTVTLASYDERLVRAARALGFAVFE